MPLIYGKSKDAFRQNVKSEMNAGKPSDQSLAIAYAIQKKNRRKMAQGGMITSDQADQILKKDGRITQAAMDEAMRPKKKQGLDPYDSMYGEEEKMAEGGEVENEKLHPEVEPMDPEHENALLKEYYALDHTPRSIAHELMKRKKMADGGMVEEDEHDPIENQDGIPAVDQGYDEADDSIENAEGGTEHIDEDVLEHEDPLETKRKLFHSVVAGIHRKNRGRV